MAEKKSATTAKSHNAPKVGVSEAIPVDETPPIEVYTEPPAESLAEAYERGYTTGYERAVDEYITRLSVCANTLCVNGGAKPAPIEDNQPTIWKAGRHFCSNFCATYGHLG